MPDSHRDCSTQLGVVAAPTELPVPMPSSILQELYNAVASELLQQAALGLERVLIDGGPCRW